MEYNKVYQSYYNRYYNEFEKNVKQRFIIHKSLKTTFGEVMNGLLDCLDNAIPYRTVIKKHIELEALFIVFGKRRKLYEEDEIDEIFKNILVEKFEDFNILSVTQKYSLCDFLREIAFLNVVHEIKRLLQINSRLFEMIYKAKMFNEFEIKEYSPIGLEQSVLFKKLNEILYPEKPQLITQNIEEKQSIGYYQPFNLNVAEGSIDFSKFLPIEKSFLFYILCKVVQSNSNNEDEFNIPYTELLRLNTIIDFRDYKSFSRDYRNSINYKVLTKGLNHFPKKKRGTFVRDLIKKTKEFQLAKTAEFIEDLFEKYNTSTVTKGK